MSSPGGRTFYLTTPIYYVNAVPHLGHAYTTIVADAMCRYRRLAGEEVYFLTGTDEHGDKIAQAAAKAGETPQAYADRIAAAFQETWRRLRITHNDFIRTTEDRHKKVVQEILQRLYDARDEIYFDDYGGLYCYGCERFYTEKELVDGKCPDHQIPPTFIKEQNYFFRMSRHQEWLVRHIEEHPDFIRPERYRNEVLGFLREPLEDLCISRPRARLEWGIPLPFDERYVTYVWFDALINYVSALGWPDGELFRRFWPAAQHLIGKDILKPHAVYWPTMLKAAGIEPYRHLNVHGYWLLSTGKISKSVGNVVEALGLADTYGLDAFRYFVLREMTFGLDARFSEEALVGRLNADLANDLGNLVARVTTMMIVNYAGGKVPEILGASSSPHYHLVIKAAERARHEVKSAMEEFAFQRALSALWEFIGVVNRYIDMTQPWRLAKEARREENEARRGRASLAPLSLKRDELNYVLYVLGKALCFLGIMLDPFLPDAAERIRDALGQTSEPRLDDAEWSRLPLAPGTPVKKLSGLFPRVEAMGEVSRSTTAKPEVAKGKTPREAAAGPEPAVSGQISIEEFSRMDLRVAEVVAAEPVPKSKKLLKLTVRLGEETRTVVAGIAGHYRPEELPGRKVIVVANLEPATLMGVESQGMVLAASEGGTLALLTLDRDLPPGAKVT